MTAIFGIVAGCLVMAAPGASDPVEYPEVRPDYRIEFPRDEGSHPEFRTEWWYVTGWLQTSSGDPLGFQITFFRSRPGIDEANPSRFAARQILFAHAALSDPKRGALLHTEKSAREGFGLASAAQGRLDVHIDDWSMRSDGDRIRTVAHTADFSLELELLRRQPPLLQGANGYSRKGPLPQSSSHYYSLPQLGISGSVTIEGRSERVRGVAWFDHEWSSSYMEEGAKGWDWVGINLDDGGALMAFRMRDERGGEFWAAATSRAGTPGAAAVSHAPEEIEWMPLRHWRSPRTGVRYPLEWKVMIDGRTIHLRPLMDDQENDARGSTGTIYWEGAVRVFDEQGMQVGRGYLELTGYASTLKF
jgi:predicted secreted hydrolase